MAQEQNKEHRVGLHAVDCVTRKGASDSDGGNLKPGKLRSDDASPRGGEASKKGKKMSASDCFVATARYGVKWESSFARRVIIIMITPKRYFYYRLRYQSRPPLINIHLNLI